VRVAALCDVHGNLPALNAVLADVPDDAAIVVGGDIAAGAFPAETLEWLRGLGDRVHWLRGNADRELTPGEEGPAPSRVLDWVPESLAASESRSCMRCRRR
jgi:predicted phosphodiesterase